MTTPTALLAPQARTIARLHRQADKAAKAGTVHAFRADEYEAYEWRWLRWSVAPWAAVIIGWFTGLPWWWVVPANTALIVVSAGALICSRVAHVADRRADRDWDESDRLVEQAHTMTVRLRDLETHHWLARRKWMLN